MAPLILYTLRFIMKSQELLLTAMLRSALVIAALVGGFFLFSLFPQERPLETSTADFVQDYLIARAVLEGENPYQPLSDLGSRFGVKGLTFSPSANPPPFAAFLTPLGLFSYRTAALTWLTFSLACLTVSLFILFRLKPVALIFGTLAAVAWKPIHSDLAIGQSISLVLLLMTVAWLLLRSGRELSGGAMIGLALSVKLLAWPFVLYLLIKKRYAAATLSLSVFVAANLVAMPVIGMRAVADYYSKIGPLVSSIYRHDSLNFSVWSFGSRLLTGTHGIFANIASTQPLVYAPGFATALTAVCVVAVLSLVLLYSIGLTFDRAFAVLVCASIVLSPTAWWFYLALTLIALRAVWEIGTVSSKLVIGIALTAPYIPPLALSAFGYSLTFTQGLLMLFPVFSLILLSLSLLQSSKISPAITQQVIAPSACSNDSSPRGSTWHT